jgi:hypothetical protein
MHPYLTKLLAEIHIEELHRQGALGRRARIAPRRRATHPIERLVGWATTHRDGLER